jgi:ATP-binding cassette subfamily F protein uup
MSLITLQNAQLAFGHVALLDHAEFSLETAERVGLIGRNGAGKSSLLRILGGLEKPDDGDLRVQQGLRVTYVAQEPQLDSNASVFESVSSGLARIINLIEQYCAGEGDLTAMQNEIEMFDGWNWEQRVQETLHRLHLDPDARINALSGGTLNRVALVVGDPLGVRQSGRTSRGNKRGQLEKLLHDSLSLFGRWPALCAHKPRAHTPETKRSC